MKCIMIFLLVLAAPPTHPFSGTSRLMITELMPDPEPPVGLPPYEYAELHNPGPDTVDLAGWIWVVGGKSRPLGGYRILPGSYAILCPAAAGSAFSRFGPVIPLESFPALRNSGDRVSLVNPEGVAVHTVDYSPALFEDALKASGGWALELADTVDFCRADAWKPSDDPSGGTPGRAGSFLPVSAGEGSFSLLRAAVYDPATLVLLFSGPPDPFQDPSDIRCQINPGGATFRGIRPPEPGFPGVFFQTPPDAQPGVTYNLALLGTIAGCSGSPAELRPVRFGIPADPVAGDLVFSEILFDPKAGEPEFVEVYNRSEKLLDLKNLIIARADTAGIVKDYSAGQDLSFLVFPGDYAVVTPENRLFRKAWPEVDPAGVAERTDLPSLTNTEAMLMLLDPNQQPIDVIRYSPDWHDPLLADSKGVSLERLDLDASGTDPHNWFSAASGGGGATPGTRNSCALSADSREPGIFSLLVSVAHPGLPLAEGRVAVSFRFGEPGWYMQLAIHDRWGVRMRELYPFGLAPSEGLVAWDGTDDEGRMVAEGIYLLIADYYRPGGPHRRWRKACAVVRDY